MGLVTTRLAYQELGAEGLGAYSAAFALILLSALVIESGGSAVQRHIAYALGQGDTVRVKLLMGTAVTLTIIASGVIALTIIPNAALVSDFFNASAGDNPHLEGMFRWIGASVALLTLQTPFRSYLIAKQNIVVVTLFEFTESASRLLAAVYITQLQSPSVASYACATFTAILFPTTLMTVFCFTRMPETRPGRLDKSGDIANFGFWMFVGALAWKIRSQGSQILIYKMCGPVATAAYGVSFQLAMYQNNLTMAVSRAARPAVATAMGSNNTSQLRALTSGSSKLLSLCTLLFSLPIIFETETILQLWLGESPALMVAMVQLSLIWMSVKDLTAGQTLAILTGDKVALHQILMIAIDISSLSISAYLIHSHGARASIVPLVIAFGVVVQGLMKVIVFSNACSTDLKEWLSNILLRYAVTATTGAAVAMLIQLSVPASPARLALLFFATSLTTCTCIWSFGIDACERDRLRSALAAICKRFSFAMKN